MSNAHGASLPSFIRQRVVGHALERCPSRGRMGDPCWEFREPQGMGRQRCLRCDESVLQSVGENEL